MAEQSIIKAVFSAARVAAKTLVMQPNAAKAVLAKKAATAAAQEIGRAAGKAASSFLTSTLSNATYLDFLKKKAASRIPSAASRSGSMNRRGSQR
jgi:hypothetical protein